MDSTLTMTSALSFPVLSQVQTMGNTFGALLIGTFVTLTLYGLMVYQVAQYMSLYPSDRFFFKFLAFGLFVLDTTHCLLLVHGCYHFLVSCYFRPWDLLIASWSLEVMPAVTGLIVLLTQSFYARHIYRVGPRYRPIVYGVVALMSAELGLIVASTVRGFMAKDFGTILSYEWIDSLLFGVVIVADLTLVTSLVTILYGKRTAFTRTNNVLDRLALYAVVATALTSTLTVPALILSMAQPHTLVWVSVAVPVTKVYSISVLAMLNCRSTLLQSNPTNRDTGPPGPLSQPAHMSMSAPPCPPLGLNAGIRVSTQVQFSTHIQTVTATTATEESIDPCQPIHLASVDLSPRLKLEALLHLLEEGLCDGLDPSLR